MLYYLKKYIYDNYILVLLITFYLLDIVPAINNNNPINSPT
jgi:hypothetical protein